MADRDAGVREVGVRVDIPGLIAFIDLLPLARFPARGAQGDAEQVHRHLLADGQLPPFLDPLVLLDPAPVLERVVEPGIELQAPVVPQVLDVVVQDLFH